MPQQTSIKELLAASLLELADTKPLNKITIQDITHNCKLRRETFYLHFQDKYDLLAWIYESQIHNLALEMLQHVPITKIYLRGLYFLREHAYFTKNAFQDSQQNCFRESIFNHVSDSLIQLIKHQENQEELSEELILTIRFFAHGSIGIIGDWIKHDFSQSPELIATALTDAIPFPIRNILSI